MSSPTPSVHLAPPDLLFRDAIFLLQGRFLVLHSWWKFVQISLTRAPKFKYDFALDVVDFDEGGRELDVSDLQ